MRIIFNEAITSQFWLVTIILSDKSEVGIKVEANSFDDATKISEQYIRTKEQSDSNWEGATIETIIPINNEE